MIEKELESIGLTLGESKVYSALLSIGPSSVGPIAKKSEVSQSKIYEVLQRLSNKGLVSFIIKNGIKHFQAVDPERILDYLEQKEEEIQKSKDKLSQILPLLKKHQSIQQKQEAEVFTGKKGLKSAYDLFMRSNSKEEEIYFMYIYNEINKIEIDKFYGSLEYFKNYNWKGIFSLDYKGTHFVEEMHKNIKFKYSKIQFPTSMDIGKENIMLIDWEEKEPIAIVINSKQITNNFRKYFEKIWENK